MKRLTESEMQTVRTHELFERIDQALSLGRVAGAYGPELQTYTCLVELKRRFHEYENAITWGVSSVELASMLDKNYELYVALDKTREALREVGMA